MKHVSVVLSSQAEATLERLFLASSSDKESRSISRAVYAKAERLKTDFHYGDPIAKKLIPREYATGYGVTNLFRLELPCFWRMLYTITNGETSDEIVVFVLDILSHSDYDRKFGYRGC